MSVAISASSSLDDAEAFLNASFPATIDLTIGKLEHELESDLAYFMDNLFDKEFAGLADFEENYGELLLAPPPVEGKGKGRVDSDGVLVRPTSAARFPADDGPVVRTTCAAAIPPSLSDSAHLKPIPIQPATSTTASSSRDVDGVAVPTTRPRAFAVSESDRQSGPRQVRVPVKSDYKPVTRLGFSIPSFLDTPSWIKKEQSASSSSTAESTMSDPPPPTTLSAAESSKPLLSSSHSAPASSIPTMTKSSFGSTTESNDNNNVSSSSSNSAQPASTVTAFGSGFGAPSTPSSLNAAHPFASSSNGFSPSNETSTASAFTATPSLFQPATSSWPAPSSSIPQTTPSWSMSMPSLVVSPPPLQDIEMDDGTTPTQQNLFAVPTPANIWSAAGPSSYAAVTPSFVNEPPVFTESQPVIDMELDDRPSSIFELISENPSPPISRPSSYTIQPAKIPEEVWRAEAARLQQRQQAGQTRVVLDSSPTGPRSRTLSWGRSTVYKQRGKSAAATIAKYDLRKGMPSASPTSSLASLPVSSVTSSPSTGRSRSSSHSSRTSTSSYSPYRRLGAPPSFKQRLERISRAQSQPSRGILMETLSWLWPQHL